MTTQDTAAAGVDPMPGGRRRIDKVLAEDFLVALTEYRSTSCVSVDTRPSRKRPTCLMSVGCCKDGWTSFGPSSPAARGRARVPSSISWRESWLMDLLDLHTAWDGTPRWNRRVSPTIAARSNNLSLMLVCPTLSRGRSPSSPDR